MSHSTEGCAGPPGWAREPLTGFLDKVRENQFATFHNKRVVVQDVCRLDRLLTDALSDWRDPRPLGPALLMHRSHGAFRAGAASAMAGQCAEAPSVLRLCLECAGYAVVMNTNAVELAEVWLRRGDSDEARKKARNAFKPETIKPALSSLDPNLKRVFSELYESLIDFGAHPNEQMITSNISMNRRPGETRFDLIYLQGDGSALDFALRRCVQIGIWSAEVFAAIFPARSLDIAARPTLDNIKSRY